MYFLHLMCFLLLFQKNLLKEKAFHALALLWIFQNQNLIKIKPLINNEKLLSNNVVKILSSLNNNEEISAGDQYNKDLEEEVYQNHTPAEASKNREIRPKNSLPTDLIEVQILKINRKILLSPNPPARDLKPQI